MAKPVLLENNITPLAGNYCLAIFSLTQARGKPPIAAQLARQFGVTPPTVSLTLRRLERAGLISLNDADKSICLSRHGKELALKLLQRQHLMSRFLNEVLGFGKEEAIEEAQRLKDAMSARVEKALNSYLTRETLSAAQNDQRFVNAELNSLMVG